MMSLRLSHLTMQAKLPSTTCISETATRLRQHLRQHLGFRRRRPVQFSWSESEIIGSPGDYSGLQSVLHMCALFRMHFMKHGGGSAFFEHEAALLACPYIFCT